MHSTIVLFVACLLFLALPGAVWARGEDSWRIMAAVGFGSVEDAAYGANGLLNVGYEFDDTFGIELQGAAGVTEAMDVGPKYFYHLELLLPATMTLCSSDSWVCPDSTIEFVIISGLGGAHFTGRWSPTVVVGAALDSFHSFDPLEIGLRVGVQGYYDVISFDRLVVMMHLNLGVIFRFGGNG